MFTIDGNNQLDILDQPTAFRHADVVHHEEVDVNLVCAGPPHILVIWGKAINLHRTQSPPHRFPGAGRASRSTRHTAWCRACPDDGG